MAGGVFSTAQLFGMTIRESATDGSDFTNPAADYRRLFLGEDGYLHVKDSAGTVTDPYSATAGNLAADRVIRTAGDVSTSSTTYVDVTGLTITETTGARRCLVGFAGSGYNNNTGGHMALTIAVDGSDEQEVVFATQHATASETMNLSATWMTAVLTAASHTIKLRMRAVTAGTATINANATQGAQFWIAELYAA